MKKVLFIMVSLFALGANAQEPTKSENFNKGNTFVTGSFKFSDVNDNIQSSVTVNNFVTNNVSVGLELGIVSTDFVASNYTVGVNARNYFSPTKKFSTFLQLGGNSRINANNDFVNYNANFGGGINYFVSKNFALEASVGAVNYNWNNKNNNDKFNVDLDLKNIKFGLIYKF